MVVGVGVVGPGVSGTVPHAYRCSLCVFDVVVGSCSLSIYLSSCMYGSLGMDIKHVCVLVFFGYYYVRCIVFVWHDYDCDLYIARASCSSANLQGCKAVEVQQFRTPDPP